MPKSAIAIVGLACALTSLDGHADENLTDLQADADAARQTAVKKGWQGSVALGYLETTGNSETSTANGKVLLGYKSGKWQDSFLAQALKASTAGVLTAESFAADVQSDYNFSDTNYVFGNISYLRDVFSGYERRTSEVVGMGHRLYNSDTQQLGMELGVGARQTRYTDETSDSEPVERAALNYLYKFDKTSSFTEDLSVEHGASNTLSQSTSALTVNLAGSFALSLSYTVTHNSTVLPGFKNTDTITALSLVYSFAPPDPPKDVDSTPAPATAVTIGPPAQPSRLPRWCPSR